VQPPRLPSMPHSRYHCHTELLLTPFSHLFARSSAQLLDPPLPPTLTPTPTQTPSTVLPAVVVVLYLRIPLGMLAAINFHQSYSVQRTAKLFFLLPLLCINYNAHNLSSSPFLSHCLTLSVCLWLTG